MICGSILRYSYSSRFLIVVSPLTAVKFESDIAAKRNVAQVNFACGDRVFEINAAEGRGDSERVMFPAYAHLSAYDRHKKLVNDYLMFYGKSVSSFKRDMSRDKTDHDVIKENHKFLWDQEKDIPDTWGARLAKKYYDKLFKEYCICDLTYYKYNKVALRWRTEKEVVIGKGQFECGSKICKEKENLRSWELNFGYIEHGEKKNALIKLRLCPECSVKLNYQSQKREVKRRKSLKRLDTNSENNDDVPTVSSNLDLDNKAETDSSSAEIQSSENTDTNESNIWKEKSTEDVEKTREKEFEEYLADLFM